MEFDDAIGGDRRGTDEAVAAALSYLDSVDPATAADAQFGWEGLSSVSPPAGPTQNSVQQFLWLHLRVLAEDSERACDVADALADLLDRLGHARYADIARSSRTRTLLRDDDERARERDYRDAVEDSGIGVPDTDLVTWQDVPEGAERAIADLIGETLEVAAVAGEFAPTRIGGPPPRDAALANKRRRLTDSVLRSQRAGGVLVEQLLDHRIALWTSYSPPRVELYRELAPVLHDAVDPAYSCVRRLEGLLRIIGDGVTLTDKGQLPDDIVARAVSTLWTPSQWPFPTGTEHETVPVHRIRGLLLRLGLVRKHHGRLLPTNRSKAMSADRLWNTVVTRSIGADYHPDAIAAEVVLADVARGQAHRGDSRLVTELLVAEGWTHDGGPVAPDATATLADDVIADLAALGAFTDSATTPSPDGIRLAAALLRFRLLHTRLPAV